MVTPVTPARPLEPDDEQWRALAATTVDHLAGVLRDLPAAPAAVLDATAEVLADPTLRRMPPEHGRALPELLDTLHRAAQPGLNPSSPGYLAFIPGSGLVSAGLAGLVADVLNRYTGLAAPAPGLVALEADLLRWLADLFGLPATAGGLFTSGGSLAAFSALVAAREDRVPDEFRRGTVYVTDQVHASVAKAARLAGFPREAVRVVGCDTGHRMDVDDLVRLVRTDRDAGRVPFCVVATAGTTNLGVIDPLPAIAEVCRRDDLWLHVDGAYGAAFQLTDRGRERLRGIEHADSLVLDPHKGFFLPFGTGCLLVRDTGPLQASHAADDAHYLQDLAGQALPDFADLGPELTREYRGIRLWLPLHLHGVAAFRAALDEKLDLAAWAHDELAREPSLTVLGPPELTIIGFHGRDDAATAELLHRVNAERRVFLSSTRVDGRFVGRIAILNHRTDKDRVAEAVDAIRRHAAPATNGAFVQPG
ncbi:MAG: aspartate aminotransferase family protein [Pseudonocardia sp.]